MLHIVNYCPCVFLKQWSMPFCAFFTTFTVVMTILVLSTDMKVGRHYYDFNSSHHWEFEKISQHSPELSSIIRNNYVIPPVKGIFKTDEIVGPSEPVFRTFKKKKFGTFVECGSDGKGDTAWLEKVLGWQGLLTNPNPEGFNQLVSSNRSRSHLAQVCISPTTHPIHAYFRKKSLNETLTAVPCFPLYSLIRAYNATYLDILSLNDVTAPLQVLRTLPVGRIRINMIIIQNSAATGTEEETEDLCCDSDLSSFLENLGYKSTSICRASQPKCYFSCSRTYCPMVTTKF